MDRRLGGDHKPPGKPSGKQNILTNKKLSTAKKKISAKMTGEGRTIGIKRFKKILTDK